MRGRPRGRHAGIPNSIIAMIPRKPGLLVILIVAALFLVLVSDGLPPEWSQAFRHFLRELARHLS